MERKTPSVQRIRVRKLLCKARKNICLHLNAYSSDSLIGAIKSIHLSEKTAGDEEYTTEHSHDYYELVVVVHGEGCHYLAGKRIPLRRGQAYLVPPKKKHYYGNFQKLVLQNIMFSGKALKFLSKVLQSLPHIEGILKNPPDAPIALLESAAISELDLIQNRIALESHQGQHANALLLFSYLTQILGIIFPSTGVSRDAPVNINGDIATAAAYMRRNYSRNIRLAELANMAHMSICSFLHHFQKEFHTTPVKWLTLLRLRHAMVFLMRSEWTIAEAAAASGFQDPLYFTRQFRKYLGCTPSQYRMHGQGRIQTNDGDQQYNDESFLLKDYLARCPT